MDRIRKRACSRCGKMFEPEELKIISGDIIYTDFGGPYDTSQRVCEKCNNSMMGKDLIKTPEASSCEVCKEEITEKVYEYSLKNFGKALCMRHQHTGNNSLSTKEKWYQENMIKGRIAETLIEELFLYLGYNVFRYGMENTVPGVMKLLKGVRGDVADNIRRMPDFVIQSNSGKNKGEVYFIEVKFRANEEFSRDELSKEYPFENCYFIVVSKKHIKCITYKELMSGKTVSPSPHNYLGDREEFELDKNVIIDFCNFAVKFFEGV